MSLKNEVVCVKLQTSKWSAHKTDKEVSQNAKDNFNAASDAGSFNKKLAPAKFLAGINSAFDNLDKTHKTMTVAWDDEGWRLLSNADYFKYMAAMDDLKSVINREVDVIAAGWDSFIQNEEQRLGKMFKVTDYPKWNEISEKYGVKIKRKILTTEDDIRIADHDQIEAAVREEIMAETAENQKRAMKDLWTRLYEPVKKLAEKLEDPDFNAQKTLVSNIYEITQVLPGLNLLGDKDLEAMYREVENRLCKHTVKKLKIDETAYAETKAAVDDIVKKMEGYL